MRPRSTARLAAFACFVALISATPRPALALDYQGPRFETVEVGGTLAQVRQQMSHIASGGHYANTHWDLHYHFTTRSGRDGCRVESATVSLDTLITMPRLRPEGSTEDVRRRWQAFETALKTHEMGHADMALSGAREMETTLRQLPTQAKCADTDHLVKRTVDAIMAEMHQHDIDYDARTNHGRTQGAVF